MTKTAMAAYTMGTVILALGFTLHGRPRGPEGCGSGELEIFGECYRWTGGGSKPKPTPAPAPAPCPTPAPKLNPWAGVV